MPRGRAAPASGKSTLLGAVNGLVPHFTGGSSPAGCCVDGRDTADHPPRELADVVGVVGQDPLAGFVTDTVEEELAYGMEQLGAPGRRDAQAGRGDARPARLADLRRRPLRELSGGQQQRVAIGAVLTAHPRVLVLDEPTSALDPTAAEEVLAAITRLVHDLGITVLVAEHRLERVVQYADRVLAVGADGRGASTARRPTCWPTSDVAPPVVELGRLAGWSPLPLSVRDARRRAGPLLRPAGRRAPPPAPPVAADRRGVAPARAAASSVRYGDVVAVREVDLDLRGGEVVALMGRNGSGKSSLLWALQGSGPAQRRHGRRRRRRTRRGVPPARGPRGSSALVPADADRPALPHDGRRRVRAGRPRDRSGAGRLPRPARPARAGQVDPALHPRDLSEGQRLALVLAIQLVAAPPVVLLDEPTRGLDYPAKARLAERARRARRQPAARSSCSTHDVEFVADAADRVVVLADGEVVADGPTADVVVVSPAFAPQVAKVLAPQAVAHRRRGRGAALAGRVERVGGRP